MGIKILVNGTDVTNAAGMTAERVNVIMKVLTTEALNSDGLVEAVSKAGGRAYADLVASKGSPNDVFEVVIDGAYKKGTRHIEAKASRMVYANRLAIVQDLAERTDEWKVDIFSSYDDGEEKTSRTRTATNFEELTEAGI